MDDRRLLEMARLYEVLDYCKHTGVFTWKARNSNCINVGDEAGVRLNSDGYKEISVDGRLYKSHRLAWFYVHGEWPNYIDHINGDRKDNRIVNLRSVGLAINNQNQRKAHSNNKCGLLGVFARGNRFRAEIRVNGKKRHLGTFDSADEAHAAYLQAKIKFHEGYCHG